MVYNKFTLGIIIRILVLVITIFVFAFLLYEYNDVLINFNFAALLILETYFLIRYVNRTNTILTNFFIAVSNSDTMLSFKRKHAGKSFTTLYDQLDRINNHVQQVKIDLNNQENFNKLIINQVNIGIIVIDDNGSVKLLNDAVFKLLDLQVFTHLKQLNKILDGFDELILKIEPESQKIIRVVIGNDIRQFLFRINLYKQQSQMFRLISFQDIKFELDIKEMESWQKLIRVLTHEITNSIGPINSTIDTISNFFVDDTTLSNKTIGELDQKVIDNAVKGIGIIKDRSVGLLNFVQKFRDLTLIPIPEIVEVGLKDLFERVKLLFKESLVDRKVELNIKVEPESLAIMGDKVMIEQVIINLLKNAIEAGGEKININANRSIEDKVIVSIWDNGRGMEEDTLENIFVPFFTTKQEGSGIGLSLSREIMRIHKGSISVSSTPGAGSKFELFFK